MANDWFALKQFTVHQDRCAMKVSTDAVLAGAWFGKSLGPLSPKDHVLDVGAGTGILSLQLAQKTKAMIDGVELDVLAASQCAKNYLTSPWANRLTCIPGDFNSFKSPTGNLYSVIVSNPPYFTKSLESSSAERNIARHDHQLNFKDLLDGFERLASSRARLALILPPDRFSEIDKLLSPKNYSLGRKLNVFSKPNSKLLRVLGIWSKEHLSLLEENLFIHTEVGDSYHPDFIELTKDFYLNF